nr:integrase, catalytic region, zinc finger, CCHC-type, peptidase aspartic, catalytic [Tanacetum cinerariifolium]
MIRYSALCDNDKQHRKKIDEQEILFDKMSRQLVEMNNNVLRLQERILEKEMKTSELEGCVSNKDVKIENCLERLNECENKLHKIGQTNQIIHMIMPSKDTLYNGRKGIGFENPSYFKKAKDLRPSLYYEKVIDLGYTLMSLIHSDEALEIEKFKRARENKIEFAYDYGNLNASYVSDKINFLDDFFQEIIYPYFEKIDSPFQQTSSLIPYVPTMILEKIIIDLEDEVVSLLEKEKAILETIESLKSNGFKTSENAIFESENQSENDCQAVKKECDQMENSKVIAPGMFKLSVTQSVSPILMSKTSCDSKNVENKTKRKRRKRKSSKQNDKQVNNDVSLANSDFVHFSDLDTFSSVRRPKQSNVIWKKKGSSSTFNVDLSSVSHSKLNEDVKRYSRKDLLSCNNSHLGETSCAYICNDAMNVSCNSRLCDPFDENNLFIFDDESVGISPIVQIFLWIIDSGCSKHMTGNRALLTNFVEKFLRTVCFGNNDFTVIAGYGDVVIGSMIIKKVYYVKGFRHNLFSVGKFCNKGLEVAFRKSTCFVRNEDGVDLLTDDRSSNLYTISLNEVASNSLTCLIAKDSSSQSWLWHQRLSHLNFATIINLVKNNLTLDVDDDVVYVVFFEVVRLQLVLIQVLMFIVDTFESTGSTRTPQQNGVMERRIQTLVEAARTMLTFANLPLFLWAEAIATACFTQNRLIIHKRFDKTPYEIMNKRKPNIKFFCVFGCRCYLLNAYEDVGKLKEKGDIGVFVRYSKESAAFRIYNKQTRKIHESMNVNFDEI